MAKQKKPCRQYSSEFLTYGFVEPPSNKTKPMCLRCQDKKDLGLVASYKISQLIAKAGKPHTIGEELILPSISVVFSTVMQQSPQQITSCIPLSNDTVSKRIDEMAGDVENQLVALLQVRNFSLQIDEALLPSN
ncbi:zinc finger BED domain-containing protein 5-like [Oratosquilla oratoria]|uniref:zinc finger BED domain-containing protein 5-like n=1 Tax=Oratosquilla oratoria TaxID=337810 RepID=UPI003F76B3DF